MQWLGLSAFTDKSPGSIPGQGTKTPTSGLGWQKKKKKKESKINNEKFDFMLKIKTFLHDQITIRSPKKMNSNFLIPLNAQALFKFT